MKEPRDITLSEKEMELIQALRASPELESAIEQLAAISRDKDPECFSADDAEEKTHKLGEDIKRSSMVNWAQQVNDNEVI